MNNNKAVWAVMIVVILLIAAVGAVGQVSVGGFTAAASSLYNFTLATTFRVQAGAGATAGATGAVLEDTTAAMYHNYTGGVDSIFATWPTANTITNGHCAGWSNSAGLITLTDTGNPCSSPTLTLTPPYLYNGTNYFVAATGYQVTLPSASPTWLNSSPAVITAGTNGDLLIEQITGGGGGLYFQSQGGVGSSAGSVEAVFNFLNETFTGTNVTQYFGVYLWDSQNSNIYTCGVAIPSDTLGSGSTAFSVDRWSYNGSGSPSYSANITTVNTAFPSPVQIKFAKISGRERCALSLDGGSTYTSYLSGISIGALGGGGYFMANYYGSMDILSMVSH